MDDAEHALRSCEKLLMRNSTSKGKARQGDSVSQQILNNIRTTIPVLLAVAEANSMAKVAVTLFKEILELEIRRQENSDQIVAVSHSMAIAMFSLRYLDGVNTDPIREQLEREMEALTVTINGFGNLCDLYYNKMRSTTMRFLRANDIKEQLGKYLRSFSDHKSSLETLLAVQAHSDIRLVLEHTTQILEALGVPSNEAEKKATARVLELGGYAAVRTDPGAIQEIRGLLAEEMNGAWTDTLDTLLSANLADFNSKLGEDMLNVTATILQQMDDTANLVKDALHRGRHDFLYDQELRVIWQENHWDDVVDGRIFAEVVLSRYEAAVSVECFNGAEESADAKAFIRAFQTQSSYQNLLEAIDDNRSGRISLQECLGFLSRKPEHITIAGWFIFWAIGYRSVTTSDLGAARDRLNRIQNILHKLADIEQLTDNHRNILSDYIDCVFAFKATCTCRWNDNFILRPDHRYFHRASEISDFLRGQLPDLSDPGNSPLDSFDLIDSHLTSIYGVGQSSFVSMLSLALPNHLSLLQAGNPEHAIAALPSLTSQLRGIQDVANRKLIERCSVCQRVTICLGDRPICDVCPGESRAVVSVPPDRFDSDLFYINELHMRKIWTCECCEPQIRLELIMGSDNRWGCLVPPHQLLHAAYVYFRAIATSHDRWAIHVLGIASNRRIAAGAVNSDSFDFVNPHDINDFLGQKPGWCSTPAWFAFWGSGWYLANQRYTHRVRNICQELLALCEAESAPSGETSFTFQERDYLDEYCRVLKILDHVTSWSTYKEPLELDAYDWDTRSKIEEISARMADHIEAEMRQKMNRAYGELGWSNLPFLGPENSNEKDIHIEKVFILLVLLALEIQSGAFVLAQDHPAGGDAPSAIAAVAKEGAVKLNEMLRALDQRVTKIFNHDGNRLEHPDRDFREYAWGVLFGWYKHIHSFLPGEKHEFSQAQERSATQTLDAQVNGEGGEASRQMISAAELGSIVARLEEFNSTAERWDKICERLDMGAARVMSIDVDD